jgi:hypothetical protein
MIEALRQFPFAFIGALVGTLALAYNVVKSPRKRLTVEELWSVYVTSRYSEVPETVEADDGAELPADELFEVVLDVRNSGNESIETSHFERPLTLRFGKDARVVLADVVEEDPTGIGASLDVGPDKVALDPVLLNAGDLMCLYLLVYRYEQVQAEGRIVGVKRVKQSSVWRRYRQDNVLALIALLLGIPVFFVLDTFPQIIPPAADAALLGFGAAGAILGARSWYVSRRDYRKLLRREDALRAKMRCAEEELMEGHADEAGGAPVRAEDEEDG